MYIFLISGATFVSVACVFYAIALRSKFVLTLEKVKVLENENETIKAKNEEYQKENIKYEAEAHYNRMLISELKNVQKSYLDSAKVSFLEIAKDINQQLVDTHKSESDSMKKLSEENISKFNNEFAKISSTIGALNSQVNQSLSSVNIVKNALLNPTGAGHLTEVTLENLLINSGLVKNIDFILQPQINQNGKILRPDAIVILPNYYFIVIDAKASSNFIKIDPSNKESVKSFVKSMHQHVKSLASKEYSTASSEYMKKIYENQIAQKSHKNTSDNITQSVVNNENIGNSKNISPYKSLGTLMFVQTDILLSKLSKYDPTFLSLCMESNIYASGPTGLSNILALTKMQIQEDIRNQNYEIIISEVVKLIESISMLTDYSAKMGNSVTSLVAQYDKFAGSFNRTFINRVRKIESLGVSHSNLKSLETLKRYQLISSSEILDIKQQ